jgi:hypothetical protein
MTHQEAVKVSRQQKLVQPDKFDRHMARARLRDISRRKKIFDGQTEKGLSRRESRKQINTSTY